MSEGRMSRNEAIYTVAGTVIGAGILALPISMAVSGFLPGLVALLVIGIASVLTSMYIAETILRTDEPLHLPRLANKYLGRGGFLLMFLGILIYIYGALTGYLSAGGSLIFEVTRGLVPIWTGTIIYFAVSSLIIYYGLKATGLAELVMFAFMMLLFFSIIGYAFPRVNPSLLAHANWNSLLSVFGIVLFAYVGHSVIPTVAQGMKHDPQGLKLAAWVGVAVPMLLYIVWSFVIVGVVPSGAGDNTPVAFSDTATLAQGQQHGQPATIPLGHIVGGTIIFLGALFAILSTMTSYMGFGLSLIDIYSGLLKISFKNVYRIIPVSMAVLLPLALALLRPSSFISALDLAGIYGGGLFAGILPPLLVLSARKKGNRKPEFVTPGGNWVPFLVFLLFLGGLVYKTWDLLTS